jgi:hypothetical protein
MFPALKRRAILMASLRDKHLLDFPKGIKASSGNFSAPLTNAVRVF